MLVCSFLLLIVSTIIGFTLFPPYTFKQQILNGEWKQVADPNSYRYGFERALLITSFVAGIYTSYWLVIRIVLWVVDGYKQPD